MRAVVTEATETVAFQTQITHTHDAEGLAADLCFGFLNLREVMVGTLFYCKTLEKETEKSNVLYICHIIYI